MKKNDVLKLLDDKKISYRFEEHPAVYTMEEMHALHLDGDKSIAKNLFLRDDKKRNYYLVSIGGDDPADLKSLQEILGSRRLSFASENDLKKLLKLKKKSPLRKKLMRLRSRLIKKMPKQKNLMIKRLL